MIRQQRLEPEAAACLDRLPPDATPSWNVRSAARKSGRLSVASAMTSAATATGVSSASRSAMRRADEDAWASPDWNAVRAAAAASSGTVES